MTGFLRTITITAVVGVIALTAAILFGQFITSGKKGPDDIDAFLYAEQAIESHLKAPSTAEFAKFQNSQISKVNDTFYVRSYVDSQNGFGAMVRSNYEVRVVFEGEKIKTSILNFEQR